MARFKVHRHYSRKGWSQLKPTAYAFCQLKFERTWLLRSDRIRYVPTDRSIQ